MATLSITLPASITKKPPAHRMVIRTADKKITYNVAMAPIEINYGGFGLDWQEINRPGKNPLLLWAGKKNRTMSFTIEIANPKDMDTDMSSHISTLKKLRETTSPITIVHSGILDDVPWRMTDLSFVTKRKHPVTSRPTWITATLEFTMAQDVVISKGPVSGGKKPTTTAKKKPKTKTTTKSKSATKTYTVKRGDTLSGIAGKVYGNTAKWRSLADKNKIKNPNLIYPGQKLRY